MSATILCFERGQRLLRGPNAVRIASARLKERRADHEGRPQDVYTAPEAA